MKLPAQSELEISRLGPYRFPSPLREYRDVFVDDGDGVLLSADTRDLEPCLQAGERPPAFERAGARPEIFFDPASLGCGIVTCGGLCPGLNDVIRSVVLTLHHRYGVRRILGFRYGYAGLAAGKEVKVRYIDPSYTIRGLPANALDSEFCLLLGQQAVHAGMSGRTDVMVGFWNRHFVHVPIPVAVAERRRLTEELLLRIHESTGQDTYLRG